MSFPGSRLRALTSSVRSPLAIVDRTQSALVSVVENTTLGMSFIGAAYSSSEAGQTCRAGKLIAGTVSYRSARTRRVHGVGVAGRGEEAGRAAPADGDGAGPGRWPGVGDFDDLVRRHRRELHGYCCRMLGSFAEAAAHVQQGLVRPRRPGRWEVLILRDVIGWPAAEVAGLLDMSVPAVNSALQRARTTLRDRWPDGRLAWAPAAEPDPAQRRLLQRFIAAHEQADPEALIAVLRDDIRLAISPRVGEWNGRPQVGDPLPRRMTPPRQLRPP